MREQSEDRFGAHAACGSTSPVAGAVAFLGFLPASADLRIRMDGKGCCSDKVFVKRR